MCDFSRRKFITSAGSTLLASSLLGDVLDLLAAEPEVAIAPMGPGSKYVPKVRAAFVRRGTWMACS